MWCEPAPSPLYSGGASWLVVGVLMIFMWDGYMRHLQLFLCSVCVHAYTMYTDRRLQWFLCYTGSICIQICCNTCRNMIYLICINLGLGCYLPFALDNKNQIHYSYTCYNYNINSKRSKSRMRRKFCALYLRSPIPTAKLSKSKTRAKISWSSVYHGISVSFSKLSSPELLVEVSEETSVLLVSSVAVVCTFCGFHYIQSTKITSLDSYMYANSIFDVIAKSLPI